MSVITVIKCVLFIVIRITEKMCPSPILSVIHTITIAIMLNFDCGNNGPWLRNVMCNQTLMAHFHQWRQIRIRISGTEIRVYNGYNNHSGNYPYRNPHPNLNQWKKFCIIQCNNSIWNPNPNPNRVCLNQWKWAIRCCCVCKTRDTVLTPCFWIC